MKKRQNYINLGSFPKKRDNEGRLICLNCEKLLEGRRQKYCGWQCSYDWTCKHSHSFKRHKMIKDIGRCAKCGIDKHKSDFILDHIIPIAVGGEEFDDSNLQLLCPECNRIKTRQDLKDIAKQRRIEKTMKSGQITLTPSNEGNIIENDMGIPPKVL